MGSTVTSIESRLWTTKERTGRVEEGGRVKGNKQGRRCRQTIVSIKRVEQGKVEEVPL